MSKHLIGVVFAAVAATTLEAAPGRPNVLIVITDDQGYGDLGCHGNPVLKTPNLDGFAKESVQLTHFYVSPVCSPTRSSLLTGRYNYRTGVVDTFVGRSMMHADEVTLAEMLRDAGYRTGLFGKWHLGDNYPLRPQDQGFEEVLTLRGGGIAQPSDPPGGSSYSNPILFQNGKAKSCKGYVTDVLTDAAIDFIAAPGTKPFFAYVAFNCPHAPFQVQDADWKPYRGIDLGVDAFPKIGSPWITPKANLEDIGRAYGMIANIDTNFGRLMAKVPQNTLVIFLTDNGPGGVRWNAGLRNRKGTVYEGGIRVPFYVRWKGELTAGRKVDTPAAHIDITPTLLDTCGVPAKAVKFDGRSVLSQLRGDTVDWPDRHLFFQWHRGDVPDLERAFAVRGQRYKLVQAAGVQVGKFTPKFELFDIDKDPFEQKDLAVDKPDLVREYRERYADWYRDVKSTRDFVGPRIRLGSDKGNPSVLTRQDWRGPKAGWTPESEGHWDVTVDRVGTYRVTVDFDPATEARTAGVQIGNVLKQMEMPANQTRVVFEAMKLTPGDRKLEAWIQREKRAGATFVEVERVGD